MTIPMRPLTPSGALSGDMDPDLRQQPRAIRLPETERQPATHQKSGQANPAGVRVSCIHAPLKRRNAALSARLTSVFGGKLASSEVQARTAASWPAAIASLFALRNNSRYSGFVKDSFMNTTRPCPCATSAIRTLTARTRTGW